MLFENFDGSDRQPREVQKTVLKWLEQNWHHKVLAVNAPTGIGKSAILRAIQVQFGGFGLVPTNVLMDQYTQSYPEANFVKGADNYHCESDSLSCADRKAIVGFTCETCPYAAAKEKAVAGKPTIFNPISYFYSDAESPEVLVIDEAHKLVEMLMLLSGVSFRKGRYAYPEITSEEKLIAWLETVTKGLRELRARYKEQLRDKELEKKTLITLKKDLVVVDQELTRIAFVIRSLNESPESFVFYTEKTKYRGKVDELLHVKPISPTPQLLHTILGSKKLILLSATLLESDVWDLGITDYRYLDVDSPIPVESRKVIYDPAPVDMGYKTSASDIAKWIRVQLDKFPGRNTIVHVTYGWAEKLKPYFPEALFNTSATKNSVLSQFKRDGGLWIAAGCAEGIDLPGDECRLNLIPMIQRGNPYDPVTKKQLARTQGQLKYNLTSIKTLIQQAGRSTRGIDDHSITVVGDNKFGRLIMQHKRYIPKFFLNSIVWRRK